MSRAPGVPTPDELETRITELRAAVRRAMATGDRGTARELRAELRAAERAWDDAVLGDDAHERGGRRASPPVRERAHQALTLLGAPAAPKLVSSVYAAFFPGEIPGARLSSLRRDEERSFRAAPYTRPYYLCAALTADALAPARGLLAVSTWPLEQRIVGPLSLRTDFLTAAIRLAEHTAGLGTPSPETRRLLRRFAYAIPGAMTGTAGTVDPAALAEGARAELDVHRETDRRHRESAARRARDRLHDAERLFGRRPRPVRGIAAKGKRATKGKTDR
ncbi:hypothetical protein D0T12_33080 [Actinomadura spongiicola]|uniref:DUF2786 domain-containing protein n=1 Tax=Actinomadura spongiicola TaxID=2303421 RepID=A0A372G7T9_9ACTN|nr:hypothetical protein [Actinomadura spongiicola]RFS81209.1 hypothetical protein D0T12_33080 [Actinomadura spongiicola]